ncbi:MAG: LeuD/DmdB family oxidoreductase small subunit [Candidatus Thorarchaeota archaeon]|jgi:3-isopropylmalate/(R)-2-methylmalate dehydratase small subunit
MTKISGGVMKYGINLDTDVIIAAHRLTHGSDIDSISQYAMEVIDPNFHEKVSAGHTIIVAGTNFGCGSSRQQAPEVIKRSGIKAIISDSMARIFFRNSINIGLPVFIVPGISSFVKEGDTITIDLDQGQIVNESSKAATSFESFPQFMMEILQSGGLINHLRTKKQQGAVSE